MSCSLRTGQVSELVSGLNAPEGIGVLNGPIETPSPVHTPRLTPISYPHNTPSHPIPPHP